MKKKFLFTILMFLFFTGEAFALTWNEALSLAQENNNELKSAKKQLESYTWTYKKAYTAFLPQLSASASMSQTGTSEAKSYAYGLSATQYLFKGLDNIYNLQSAYAEVEYYQASLQSVTATVLYDVRSAFVDLFVSQKNIELLDNILKQRNGNTRLIKLRYESGREDKGNLMRTQADEAQAGYDLSSARRDLKLARLKLSQMLQKEIGEVKEEMAVQDLSRPDFEQLAAASPSYLMAKYQLETAEIAQKATLSGFLPSVYLSGSYSKRGSAWPPDSESSSLSLNVSYSFFPGGSNFTDRAIYNAKLDKAREDFENSIKDVRYSLEEAYEDLNDAVEALKIGKIYLEATQERAAIAQAKYLNGLIFYDDWDRIESEYISAQKKLLSYQKTAYLASALWHKSYGGYVK